MFRRRQKPGPPPVEEERATDQTEEAPIYGEGEWLLSPMDGGWEAIVSFVATPGAWPAVTVIAGDDQTPAGTVFALVSAFSQHSRLEDLRVGIPGWAVVRAWPLNAPHLIDDQDPPHTEHYLLCSLRSLEMRDVSPVRELFGAASPPENSQFDAQTEPPSRHPEADDGRFDVLA